LHVGYPNRRVYGPTASSRLLPANLIGPHRSSDHRTVWGRLPCTRLAARSKRLRYHLRCRFSCFVGFISFPAVELVVDRWCGFCFLRSELLLVARLSRLCIGGGRSENQTNKTRLRIASKHITHACEPIQTHSRKGFWRKVCVRQAAALALVRPHKPCMD
jgi:hypothetical protein